MMGASVCKPCVKYASICLQSSSSEGGTYNLRRTDNTKHRKNLPRSSSICVGTMNASNDKNAGGFWNSWEYIHKSKGITNSLKFNGTECKFQCRPLSKGANKPSGSENNSNNFMRNVLRRNLSYDTNKAVFEVYKREWNSEDPMENCGNSTEYSYSRQLDENKLSRSSSLEVQCSSSNNVSINFEESEIDFESRKKSESNPIHQGNFVSGPSTHSHQKTLEKNYNANKFEKNAGSIETSDEDLIGVKKYVEVSRFSDTQNSEPTDILESDAVQDSFSDSPRIEPLNGNIYFNEVSNVSTGVVSKIRPLNSCDMGQSFTILKGRKLDIQSNSRCLPEEVGKRLDPKNMTAEVGTYPNILLNNYNISTSEKDVLDNGTTLLNNRALPTPRLATEKDRLKTFKNWSNKNIDPKKLAAAGFYYSGKTDIVECFKCGIKGHNWVENDKPMEDHMRWNKNCPFVRENTTERDNAQSRPGRDICGNLGVEIFPYSETEDKTEPPESPNLERLGIRKAKGPSHPDQIIYETRLATFENWPKSLKQKPAELASAGFYYLGIGDQTLCFYCGGGLKDWVEEDDPWEQHALWFPKCNFLLMKKNPAFVEAVQAKHKILLSSKRDEPEDKASCSTSENAKEPPSALIQEKEQKNPEESSTLCKICFKNELGVVFLPCGHMVACIDCASALKECAICRKGIQATVRAFLA